MQEPLFTIAGDLNRRFPEGNEPYQIMTRLLEECGELAQQVNHFESSGLKQVKYGEPDARKMSKEILDVVRAALQVALFYRIEQEVEARFEEAFTAIGREG